MSLEDLLHELGSSQEYFFIGKQDGKYRLIHSDLTNVPEWTDMIEHFKQQIEDKLMEQKKQKDALNDLLGDVGMNQN